MTGKRTSWIEIWKTSLADRKLRMDLVYTLIMLYFVLSLFTKFLLYVEGREGIALDDPLFHSFTAIDLNVYIFILIYLSLIAGLISLTFHPRYLVIALQSYMLMVFLRMALMYVTPLEPPMGTIDLQDPLVFMIGTGQAIRKDLFFSGHTATLFLLYLTCRNKKLKIAFLISTILVGILVILQKAHYTVDVLAAPLAAYVSFRIVRYFNRKYLPVPGI